MTIHDKHAAMEREHEARVAAAKDAGIPRYEYRIVSMSSEVELCRLGATGWRVILNGGGSIVMERPLSEDDPADDLTGMAGAPDD